MHEEQTPQGADAETGDLAAALSTLEGRVRQARGASEDEPVREAARLGGIERDLLRVTQELTFEDPDLADDRGHPVLADLARWRTRCEGLGLDAEAAGAGALLDELVDDEATRWRQTAERVIHQGTASDCFEALAEASVLDREALRRRGDQPGEPPLADAREGLRGAYRAKLEAHPASEKTRELWATDLLDRADVVLTGIDDLGLQAATAQLEVTADDLAWHVSAIETSRGSRRSRLKRKVRRVGAEIQERGLQARLDGIFGERLVAWFERLVLALIVLVLGLLVVELVVPLSPETLFWFTIVDSLACLVFLWDFFFRLALVQGKWRWFTRHWFVDLLPSIPFGLLALSPRGADSVRAGRAIRLLRLPRVARYIRVLMPLIRTVRAVGFLTRGVDRIVRRYGHLLNRDVILYPTREELRRARDAQNETASRLRRLQAEVTDLWEELLLSADGPERDDVARCRIAGLEAARRDAVTQRPPVQGERASGAREIPAETLLHRLERVTPEGVVADLGSDFVTRAARVVRLFSKPPLRWLPVVGGFFPKLGPRMSDAAVVAAGAHQASRRMRRYHDRWFWFADLYGTVTPAEFVDRVGSTMMRSAFRPAYRLTLIGGIFVLVQLFLMLVPWDLLHTFSRDVLGPLVGTTLVVLGGVCVVVLAVGWWLKHVAGKATNFYEQTARAQFVALSESIKGRFLNRDAAILSRRVVGPEALLGGVAPERDAEQRQTRFVDGVKALLLAAHSGGHAKGAFDAMERTVLLHRDGMDGGLLHESDTRTTNQLLGNPVLRYLRRNAWCIEGKERKQLRTLDLEHQRRMLGGPYFWFSLVNRAVVQSVARLIVTYNRHAVPLAELPAVHADERTRYEMWLTDEESVPLEGAVDDERYVTAAFTALHFLDDDPGRDREVAQRFGPPVLRRLERDRRRLFRRIFGTYPLHTRPHEQRVVNLYRMYEEWLSGGRALLLPLRGIWSGIRWIGRVVAWVAQAVHEIRYPRTDHQYETEAEADFATAVRKIDRMRGPVVRTALWMRARMDCEYVGIRLPGARRTGLEGVQVRRDLDFLDAPSDLRRAVEAEHDCAQADMRRFSRLLDGGFADRLTHGTGSTTTPFGREHLRASAFAYRSDMFGVRSLLSAEDVLEETFSAAARRPVPPRSWWPRPKLWWSFRTWWKENGSGGRLVRRAAWRAVVHDTNGVSRALRVVSHLGADEAKTEGERRLRELMRHPGRLSGQLVTLRAVQTMALIDVLNYRTHVWRLGQYGADGDEAGDLLTLSGAEQIAPPPGVV